MYFFNHKTAYITRERKLVILRNDSSRCLYLSKYFPCNLWTIFGLAFWFFGESFWATWILSKNYSDNIGIRLMNCLLEILLLIIPFFCKAGLSRCMWDHIQLWSITKAMRNYMIADSWWNFYLFTPNTIHISC